MKIINFLPIRWKFDIYGIAKFNRSHIYVHILFGGAVRSRCAGQINLVQKIHHNHTDRTVSDVADKRFGFDRSVVQQCQMVFDILHSEHFPVAVHVRQILQ